MIDLLSILYLKSILLQDKFYCNFNNPKKDLQKSFLKIRHPMRSLHNRYLLMRN